MFGKSSRGLDTILFELPDIDKDSKTLEREFGLIAEKTQRENVLRAFKDPKEAMKDYDLERKKILKEATKEYHKAGKKAQELGLPTVDVRNYAKRAAAGVYNSRMELIHMQYPWADDAEALIELAGGSIPGKKKAKKGIPAGNKQPEEQ